MCNPHFFQNCGSFQYNINWLCFDFMKNYHNFERNEDRATVFLKWKDFRFELLIRPSPLDWLQRNIELETSQLMSDRPDFLNAFLAFCSRLSDRLFSNSKFRESFSVTFRSSFKARWSLWTSSWSDWRYITSSSGTS